MTRDRQIELMESRARRASATAERLLRDSEVRKIVTQRDEKAPEMYYTEDVLEVRYG